jgi:hypothetical protein
MEAMTPSQQLQFAHCRFKLSVLSLMVLAFFVLKGLDFPLVWVLTNVHVDKVPVFDLPWIS